MPSSVRTNRVRSGKWRTVQTLWNTTATGRFEDPAGAKIKVRYGGGWWFGKDRQKQTLDGAEEKVLRVGRWSLVLARMQVRVEETTDVTWVFEVFGPS